VSNNAPRNISDLDATARAAGVEVAKKWLDGSARIGAKTMRVNTGGPRIIPAATAQAGSYPKNDEVVKYLANAVDSFKRMADHGGKVGVKVTIENHWGLSADPIHIRIILDEVNHPFCEASPDFCNWEHEYMLHHGLQSLLPYTHTTVHAKYWNRWTNFDIGRSVRVMSAGGFKGIFALEIRRRRMGRLRRRAAPDEGSAEGALSSFKVRLAMWRGPCAAPRGSTSSTRPSTPIYSVVLVRWPICPARVAFG
jgi:hypothetical protein